MNKVTKKTIAAITLLSILIVGSYAPYVSANQFFDDNDIRFYDPTASATCTPSGSITSDASVSDSNQATANLPQQTISALDSQGIKQKAESSKSAYMEAEKEGVPWAVMAAVHYREATMNPNRSIADGGSLGRSRSMDGIKVGSTLAEDVQLQTKHFKEMAKSVYGITLTMDSTGDEWGYAFLAYNRGFMYKNWNKTFQESPYVMNGYDSNRINMRWNDADSFTRPGGGRLNNVSGKTNSQIGAMSVLAYLGGPTAGGVACDPAESSGAVNGNIVETGKAFAWETPTVSKTSRNWEAEAKPAFVAALKAHNPSPISYLGHNAYADCGIYVSTVMRASGADKDFPPAGTSNQMPYMKNSDKYINLGKPNISKLQPGDILIFLGSGAHISIYSGPIGTHNGEKITMLDASMRKRNPSYRTNSQLIWMTSQPGVEAFRLK